MAETSTIFGFMKYVSATDILSDFKKTVDSHFVNSLGLVFLISLFQMNGDCSLIKYALSASHLDIALFLRQNYFFNKS